MCVSILGGYANFLFETKTLIFLHTLDYMSFPDFDLNSGPTKKAEVWKKKFSIEWNYFFSPIYGKLNFFLNFKLKNTEIKFFPPLIHQSIEDHYKLET